MTLRDLKVRRVITKALLYAVMIVVAIYTVGPFVWAISTAFKGPEENVYAFPPRILPEEPTLSNFVTAWKRALFWAVLYQQLAHRGGSILINIRASSMAGYARGCGFPGSLAFSYFVDHDDSVSGGHDSAVSGGPAAPPNTHLGVILPTAVGFPSSFSVKRSSSCPRSWRTPPTLTDVRNGIYWRIMLL